MFPRLRARLGELLVRAGAHLLEFPEGRKSTYDWANDDDWLEKEEDEDYDVAPAMPVQLSGHAEEMIRLGRPMPPPPPPPPPPSLQGSLQERWLKERNQLLGRK
jgi:hypothetical protein